ncbi:MAG: apolipoprotein N-acyltransferase, partial [Aestuariivirgaceae bacterium]|nr:apolipoprotein N-acyltransferase [Aestuariivirgaceae bacterium]
YLALYWGLAAWAAGWLKRPGFAGVLVFAACLTLGEYARANLFSGFPWNAPGHAALASPGLAQAASVTGLWGLTFGVLVAAATPWLIFNRQFRAALACGAALVLIWGAGEWRLASHAETNRPDIRLRIVQPNIPQSEKWRFDNAGEIFTSLLALSDLKTGEAPMGASDFTHIIWPESAVPFLMDEQEGALSAIARLLPDNAHLLMGGLRREMAGGPGIDDDRIFNSLLAISGTGEVAARADKFHLVPWGEYLPLESWLAPLGLRRLVTLPGSFVAGPGPQNVKIPGTPAFSPLICYEVIFPGAVAPRADRPQFLLNVTNDGWFGTSTGPYQHFDQARLRAIEEGLPLVRAANTGISGVVDALGRVRHQSRLNETATVDSPLPQDLEPTIYVKLGDIPVITLVLLIVFVCGCFRKNNPKVYSRRHHN